jgi:hypothetical protein
MAQIPREDKVRRESDGLNETGTPLWWTMLILNLKGSWFLIFSYAKHLFLANVIRSLCRTAMWQSVAVSIFAPALIKLCIYSVMSS